MIRAWFLVGTLLAAAACSDTKQIVLSIDTTVGIPCDIDHIRIRATASGTTTFERDVTGARLPLNVNLSDETRNGVFDLEVTGLKGSTEVLQATGPLQFGSGGGDLAAHVVLEASCPPSAHCGLPELTRYAGPPPPVTARFQCGANVTHYNLTFPATETFHDACTTPGMNTGAVLTGAGAQGAEKLGLSDDAIAGFTFKYYGRPIRQIWAHKDGYISFQTGNPDPEKNLDAGSFDRNLLRIGVPPPPQSAMIFWDKLTLSPAGVCYALEGSPGFQKLRVTWDGACQNVGTCGSDSLSFTIVLDERNGRVSFTYGDMITANPIRAQGSSATVGIVNKVPDMLPGDGCVVADCNSMTGICNNNGTPCGYTQVFSKMPQTPRVPNFQFDPAEDQ